MYTAFFHLSGRPFQLSPDPRFFFATRSHRHAMAQLSRGLDQGEGFIVITGDVGTGKTTLIDYLCAQIGAHRRFLAARLEGGRIEPGEALALVARALGVADLEGTHTELFGRIDGALRACHAARRRVLLIVDEAQNWPLAALEELRILSNLRADGRPLLQVLLVGQSGFREQLARADHEPLRERIVARAHLEPLEASEIPPYVEHRLKRVDWRGDPRFTAEAYRAIHTHSGGVPRRVNLLCSRALVLAAIEERHEIDADAVAEVVSELELERGPAQGGQPRGAPLRSSPLHPPTEAAEPGAMDEWRNEVLRLQRKLEQAFDDLSGERARSETIRSEIERLRAELQRIELDRLRTEAETSRRAVEVLIETTDPEEGDLLRRLVHEDA